MIDPNKGVSTEKLDLFRQGSYERICTQLKTAIEQKLADFQMTWDDLAERLQWEGSGWDDAKEGILIRRLSGKEVRQRVGSESLAVVELNDIAHVFSAEVYMIFRPRYPWIGT